MTTIDIPVGKIFPAGSFDVVYKNGVVSALPKGEHTYIVGGRVEKRVDKFPHVSMIPFDAKADGNARAKAGSADFVLRCAQYHVTGSGQARIWREFDRSPCLKVIPDSKRADSNLGVDVLKDLQNRFLNALEKSIGEDISGA